MAQGGIDAGLGVAGAALEAGGSPNAVGFQTGVARLGTSFVDAFTFSTQFSATQHDGVHQARHWAYAADCTCMTYTSPPYPIP